MQNRFQAVLIVSVIFLSGCAPEHTTSNGFLSFEPDPGYAWANDGSFTYNVVWKAGVKHPVFSNIYSAYQEGSWVPNFGYDWSTNNVNDLNVNWQFGKTYIQLPHICSSTKEGAWDAEDGYTFKDPNNTLEVVWNPGDRGIQKSHVYAADIEGTWALDPGYEVYETIKPAWLVAKPSPCSKRPLARWKPGLWHNQFEHVYSDTKEGYWQAESGYRFVSSDSLNVVASSEAPPVGTSDSASQFWGGVIKVLAGAYFSSDQPDDGAFASTIGRPAARELRNSGLNDIGEAITNSK